MAHFVKDKKTGKVVVFPPERVKRPSDAGNLSHACPFCPGQEGTNEEILRIGSESEWRVRVIGNKFPIVDIHEVIIHSPDHYADLGELPTEQVERIVRVYLERSKFHQKVKNGNVLIYLNHNLLAGQSLHHPHSQIAVVPFEIELHTEAREPEANVVYESEKFVIFCPDYSEWEYEIWIAPKERNKLFSEINEEEIKDFSRQLKKMMFCLDQKMPFSKQGSGVSYNFYIYHERDWFLRIVPRIAVDGGLEIGTGITVNEISPNSAANEYKKNIINVF